MAQTKVEGLLATYAGMTAAERIEFRAMLAGWDARGQSNAPQKKAEKAAAPMKKAAGKPQEA